MGLLFLGGGTDGQTDGCSVNNQLHIDIDIDIDLQKQNPGRDLHIPVHGFSLAGLYGIRNHFDSSARSSDFFFFFFFSPPHAMQYGIRKFFNPY